VALNHVDLIKEQQKYGKNKSSTSKTKPSLGRETKTWGNAESLEGRSARETEKLGRQFAFQPEST